jgi:Electron transfer DM13
MHLARWLSAKKWIVLSAGLPILIAVWWASRPEKLWINQKVDEPSPNASETGVAPLYTGRLEGGLHHTTGRATIYRTREGKQYLRLSDFSTSNGQDVHVLLANSLDPTLKEKIVKGTFDAIELGPLKGNHGDQRHDLPASVDLKKYDAIAIYCARFHALFGEARMEEF